MAKPLLEELADYAYWQIEAGLPFDVQIAAKRALVDWYASAIVGSTMAPMPHLLQAFADEIGTGRSRLIWGPQATVRAAAMLNGTASHAAEVDDVFRDAVYHPGSPIIAAALSVGYSVPCSGEDLLKAIVVGYEISTRIAAEIFEAHYEYWHPTGTVGCIGAACAAAIMLGLSKSQFIHAVATATTFAAGLQQAFRSETMTKPLHAGHASEVGAMAALAARAGVTGAADIIDGPSGFLAAFAEPRDWSGITAGLGTTYNICGMTTKNHCCCGQAFIAIDAALAVRDWASRAIDEIETIEIAIYKRAIEVAGTYQIDGPTSARFSIPYVVAHALLHGSVRLKAFEQEALESEPTRALMSKITLRDDPKYNSQFPTQRAASIAIRLKDGSIKFHEQPTRKGDPDLPLTDVEMKEKFDEFVVPVKGVEESRRLFGLMSSIETSPSLDCL